MINPGGLISSVLGLVDRFAKARPDVWLTARTEWHVLEPYLVVSNRSRFPIRIRALEVEPDFIVIMTGEGEMDGAKALIKGTFTALIAPDSERSFPIVVHSGISDENASLPCRVKLSWRSMRRPEAPCFPVVLRTSVKTIRDMLSD